jgi:hypothetical protein
MDGSSPQVENNPASKTDEIGFDSFARRGTCAGVRGSEHARLPRGQTNSVILSNI